MKISGIYKIQSLIKPEMCYIGSSMAITQRWQEHLRSLKNNKHRSIKLQRHFNKYGKNDLRFSILIGCEKNDLITTEQFFIDCYNPYFNNYKIAGSPLGAKRSMEAKEKNRKAHIGKIPWNKGKYGVYSEITLSVEKFGLGEN